jgi:4-aminobutyrate aminotransferase
VASRTDDVLAREDRLIADAMKIRFYPFVAAEGQGSRVEDPDGVEYLDFLASGAVMALGYRDPRVRERILGALDSTWSTMETCFAHPLAGELAQRLVDLVPGDDRKVWLGHCGSDAMDCVAQLVPLATGRPGIVSFSGSYHGQTAGSSAISGHPSMDGRPVPDTVTKVPYPDPYRCPAGPCNPSACSLRCLKPVEEAFADGEAADIGAVVIEAIQSDGGDIVPPDNFLPALRELCDRHGILLVVDEVKTGLGRTGRMFAFEHCGITPDAVALGKALGGGLPLSAVVGRADLLDARAATISYTLGGGPAPCAGAMATLDAIGERGFLDHVTEMGKYLLDGLRGLQRRHPLIGDVRGRGLILGVELVEDRTTRAPATQDAARVVYRCFELGLLTLYCGVASNVIELTPPLTITRQDADEALMLLDQAFTEVASGSFDDAKLARFGGW